VLHKQALVRSQSRGTEHHLQELSESTCGVVFLGTPHKGAQLAHEAARLAGFVGLVKQTNQSNLRQLQKGFEDLDLIQEDFDNLLRCHPQNELPEIQIKCLFEQLPTTGIGLVCCSITRLTHHNILIGRSSMKSPLS
jgi:hypothetical protein